MRITFYCVMMIALFYGVSVAQLTSVTVEPNAVQYEKIEIAGIPVTYDVSSTTSYAYIGNARLYAGHDRYQRLVLEYDFSSISAGAHLSSIDYSTLMHTLSSGSTAEEQKITVSVKSASESKYTSSPSMSAWNDLEAGDEYFTIEANSTQSVATVVVLASNSDLYEAVAQAIANQEKLYVALVSTEESTFFSTDACNHKVRSWTSAQLKEMLKINVAYTEKFLVTFKTDYKFTDPAGPDFLIDGVGGSLGDQHLWEEGEKHDLEAISHDAILMDDGEEYELRPAFWFRETENEEHGSDFFVSWYLWNDATADWDATMHCFHYKIVKYQVFTREFGTHVMLPGVSITCEQRPYTQGEILYRTFSEAPGTEVDVEVPLKYYDSQNDANYFFVTWVDEEYSSQLDDAGNSATFALFPEFNRVLGSNKGSYYAEYQKLKYRCIDTGNEIDVVPPSSVTYSTNNTMLVSIPYSITSNNVRYFFWKWDDGSLDNVDKISNVVTRTIDVNDRNVDYDLVTTAVYKAHMISGSAFSLNEPVCGTCPNSQRKVSWMPSQFGVSYLPAGVYQTVYESKNNSIWYTYSIDGGITWADEVFIDYGKSPSMAYDKDRTYILYTVDDQMVYADITIGATAYHTLTPVLISTATECNPDSPPVIEADAAQNLELIIWPRSTGELYYAIVHAHVLVDYGYIQGAGASGSAAEHPTVAHIEGSSWYHIAWREGVSVYYTQLDIQATAGYYLGLSQSATKLLSNYYHFAYGYPTITVDISDYPCVAWSSFDISLGKFISFRQNSQWGWGPTATFISLPNHDYWAPSVSSLINKPSGDDIRIAHNDGFNSMVVQRMSGGYWMAPGYVQSAEGMYPSVCKFTPVGSNLELFSAPTNTPSTAVKIVEDTQEHLNKNTYKRLEMGREIAVHDTCGTSRLMISDPVTMHSAATKSLDWQYRSLEAIIDSAESVAVFMRTMPFVAESGATLRFKIVAQMRNSYAGNASLVLELVDSLTNDVLHEIDSIALAELDTSISLSNVIVPLSQYANTKLYLLGRLSGASSREDICGTEYYYDEFETLEKRLEVNSSSIAQAEGYSLSLYPNPCKDVVTATIKVHSERSISIFVSDVIGTVKYDVFNSVLPEGEHSFKVDLSSLPTGRYFVVAFDNDTRISKVLQVVK